MRLKDDGIQKTERADEFVKIAREILESQRSIFEEIGRLGNKKRKLPSQSSN